METPLDTYRRVIAQQPPCDAVTFAAALSQYRAGDESAARTISGGCLPLALQHAGSRAADFALPLLDVIQEANAGLWEAVTTFPGNDLDKFLHYVQNRIEQHLAVLA